MFIIKYCVAVVSELRRSLAGRYLLLVLAFFTALTVLKATVYASIEYTPMLAASDFAGVKTDVGTAAAGILSIVVIVLGIGILVRVLSK